MTDIERNRAIVLDLFRRSEAGEDIFPLLADDVEWIVPGTWELAGIYRKDQLAAVFGLVLDDLGSPPVFTIHSVTAEDNRVAVHAQSRSAFRDGEPFGNHYHFLFHLRDGLIVKVLESMDTDYMSRVIQRRRAMGASI